MLSIYAGLVEDSCLRGVTLHNYGTELPEATTHHQLLVLLEGLASQTVSTPLLLGSRVAYSLPFTCGFQLEITSMPHEQGNHPALKGGVFLEDANKMQPFHFYVLTFYLPMPPIRD